ncbi:MAG: helicase [Chloroflexi bacterium]|nr:helicase [Chloroflexota bacterium]
MNDKPEFVDNRGENTLASALQAHLDWLAKTYAKPVELSIASGYFNPQGFLLLADRLEGLAGVRLMIGAEPIPPPAIPKRKPGDPRGERFDEVLVNDALRKLEQGLLDDRDLLGLSVETDQAIERLLAFLESGLIEVRRYERAFLHGKAFIFNDNEGVIAGSSNFTRAGLTSNLELNLGRYDPHPVEQVKDWFDDLWEEAAPYDLAAVYEARLVEHTPYTIFLRVLWELYGEELQEMAGIDSPITLTTFQNDGIDRALRILDRYNGVIVADGVGLGKSFIAGEIIRRTVQEQRQRALLIAPAALRDGAWARFQARQNLYFEMLSYEQLVADRQLGGDQINLDTDIQDYQLVVIDESQAFRNPLTSRAHALRLLLQGKPPKKLLQLSATPVNNSLWDLYNLLAYFIGHDARFADRGIPSLKERFQTAVNEDPYDLEPDLLFDILDAVTVRRTRSFVKRWYANERIPGPDGEPIVISFPTPRVDRVSYELDDVLPGFFDEFEQALMPEEGEPLLSMARYTPLLYLREGVELEDPEEYGRQLGLIGLLRSGLLKRFESSSRAFSLTANKMADSHDAFLASLDRGYIPSPAVLDEWGEVDNDEAFDELLAESGSTSTDEYDLERLRDAVTVDRDLLRHFAQRAESVRPTDDPKLAALVDELAEIALQAEEEGLDAEDARNKRKVLVFSYFADTVDWIEDYLREQVESDPRLEAFRGRIASVSSQQNRHGVRRDQAVFGFAPVSTDAPVGSDDDRFEILVTTDVLAEGQNLQQARHTVNYDLPWNPMRLVQRNGRIDRIASRHNDIYIRCFFPDARLDALLDLEERVRRKLAQAAASIGLESEVIPEGATSEQVFADTRAEIAALQREETAIFERAGEELGAHSGEEYRQILRRGLEQHRDWIESLPWAAGSGFAAGLAKGHFFCATIGNTVALRFVHFEEDELIDDTLGCLRMIDCEQDTERAMPGDLREGVYAAWQRAREDIFNKWQVATDPSNLQPRIPKTFRRAAAHLRAHPPQDMPAPEFDDLLDTVEAPWGTRYSKVLREVLNEEEATPEEITQQLVEKIAELGMQPFRAPEPLPVIEQEEVQLICWMAVDAVAVQEEEQHHADLQD